MYACPEGHAMPWESYTVSIIIKNPPPAEGGTGMDAPLTVPPGGHNGYCMTFRKRNNLGNALPIGNTNASQHMLRKKLLATNAWQQSFRNKRFDKNATQQTIRQKRYATNVLNKRFPKNFATQLAACLATRFAQRFATRFAKQRSAIRSATRFAKRRF